MSKPKVIVTPKKKPVVIITPKKPVVIPKRVNPKRVA